MYHYIRLNFTNPRCITFHSLLSPNHVLSPFTAYTQHTTMYHFSQLTVTNSRYKTLYFLLSTPHNISLFTAYCQHSTMYHFTLLNLTPKIYHYLRLSVPPNDVSQFNAYCQHPTIYHDLPLTLNTPRSINFHSLLTKFPRFVTIYCKLSPPHDVSLYNAYTQNHTKCQFSRKQSISDINNKLSLTVNTTRCINYQSVM